MNSKQWHQLTGQRESSLLRTILVLCLMIMMGCMTDNKPGQRRGLGTQGQGTDTETKPDPQSPDFGSNLNYLQNGSFQTSSALNIPIVFNDSLYLRGQQIDQFIKNGNSNNIQCLVVPFPQNSDRKVLVVTASPRFFSNISNNTRENYYLINMNDRQLNQSFCLKTGLINQISIEHNTTDIAYNLAELCDYCDESLITSTGLKLYSPSGAPTTNVSLHYLNLRVTNYPDQNIPPNASCTTSSECVAKGFDCCSENQCVKDKQVKSATDQTSAEFMQAMLDIQHNPANILNYPRFFHLCSQNTHPPDTPPAPGNPDEDARARFIRLQELYNCTTQVQGEMSICTMTYEDASQSPDGLFYTSNDDRSFASTYTGSAGIAHHSIHKISYAGEVLFEEGKVALNGAEIGANNSHLGNDNLDDPLVVRLTKSPSSTAPDDTLKIYYKIDGSCERINSALGRCTKYYTQGQNLGQIDDHYPASNQFMLPYYADVNRTIKVEVDSTPKLSGSQWQTVPAAPAYIEFLGNGLQVFDSQKVAITFFVDLNSHKVLNKFQESIDSIKNICQCADDQCRLRPLTENGENRVIDFACVYPQPDVPPPPLQQEVLLSSKSIPHLYYDAAGVYQANPTLSSAAQEGTPFQYISNNQLRPNNVDNYIGFNEIYGSFSMQAGAAKPATEVRVVRGKTYDIFVDSGSLSTCASCGHDYYSTLRLLFPNTFNNPGGGYTPNLNDTDRTKVTDLRADDLIFGRACFSPATMLPWSHTPISDLQSQRLRRLQTQHFYFANGYMRDWYGFDYGSIIGSWDGVNWFSVGSQRRIKANSNRLLLAVNTYFGDLTQESTFKIVVSDASNIPNSGSEITSDFDSDGAQCQRMHTCQTDVDCATTLGWEYSCQTITNLETPWPRFDANGFEIPNAVSMERLQALFGANKGGPKRCVYRGRGAACQPNLDVTPFSLTFNGSTQPGLLGCSSNNYCQVFTDGSDINRFNTKIARYGRSVANQNASQFVAESDLDTFGLGARTIGRPMKYNGDQPIPTEVLGNMNSNNIAALCLPGRNPQALTINSQNSSAPTNFFLGDKVHNIGMTTSGQISPRYLNACSVFDADNNYYHLKTENINESTQNARFRALAGTQALASNSVKVFEQLNNDRISKNFEVEHITSYTLEENRCMRAPGAACHTDQDCAPNNFISNFVRNLDPTDPSLHDMMNLYELFFWQEKLVCGQAVAKNDPSYDLRKNRCCRETGNLLTIGTFKFQGGFAVPLNSTEAPQFNQLAIPGVDLELNDPTRSSRMAPVRFDMFNDPDKHPPLVSARADICGTAGGCVPHEYLNTQFNTLDKVAKRTCCSGNWIRHWNKDENGGGHRWEPGKLQNIRKENFRCLNWIPNPSAGPGDSFNCTNSELPDDPDCFSRSVSSVQAAPILDWLGKFELTGIPQIGIESDDFAALDCSVAPNDQSISGAGIIIPGLLRQGINTHLHAEYQDTSGNNYYAADDEDNFEETIKKVFSRDQFSCCLPTGTPVPAGTNRDQCCTGFINGQNGQCALPDFTNVSLYLNRFVSSEGSTLNDTLYDAQTGFIKSPSIVEQVACQRKICASGTLARGVAHSPLKVRGHENSDFIYRRFLDGNDQSNNFSGLATLFDEGMRWNNHVYCVPSTIEVEDPTLTVIQCN